MKKILLCSHNWSYTGAPIVLKQLAEGLVDQYEISLFGYGKGPLLNEAPKSGVKAFITGDGCIPAINHVQPDLIIANTLLSYHAVLEGFKRKIPVIWWLHEGALAQRVLWQDIMMDCYSRSRLVVSAEYLKQLYSTLYQIPTIIKYGIPTSNIIKKEIIWGQDQEVNSPHQENSTVAPASSCGDLYPSRPLHFLVAGTVEWRKGQGIAAEAYTQFLKTHPTGTRLTFIGSNWNSPYAQQILKWASAVPSVTCLTERAPGVFAEVLDSCDVLLCPSRDEGGYPQVLLQAQERGKLVIASDVCGMKEQVPPGTGLVVANSPETLALTMRWLMSSKPYGVLQTYGNSAREWVHKNNSMEEHISQWKKLIEEEI
jgi:glycosyltransferase involved in cell wall biosynthesis